MLNNKWLTTLAAGVGLAALGACTSLPVTTDSNPNMSVSACHTYAFAQEHVANVDQPAAFGNPLNAERLRVAIQSNLAAKGLTLVADRASAECVVGFAMGTRQTFSDFYGGWGLGFGYGWGHRFGGSLAYSGPYVSDETRISIDLFDAKSRTPIWHAAVSQSVRDLTGPNAEVKINAAAAAIFAKYPGGAAPMPAAGKASA